MNNIFKLYTGHMRVNILDIHILTDNVKVEYYDNTFYNQEDAAKFIEKFILGFVTPSIVYRRNCDDSVVIIAGAKYYKAIKDFYNNNLILNGYYYDELKDKLLQDLTLPIQRRFYNKIIHCIHITDTAGFSYSELFDIFSH